MLSHGSRSRLAVVAMASCLAVLVSAGATTASMRGSAPVVASAAGQSITFETPRVTDPIHTYGEPNIGISPNQPLYVSAPSDKTRGEVYVSGPTGTGTQRSVWQGSVDGGHTFRNIARKVPLLPIDPCGTLGTCTPLAAPGGGDTEINFDHHRKQYFADLYALACQHVATRTVDGTTHQETVNENYAPGGCPFPGSDRQWILVRDPYIEYGPTEGGAGVAAPFQVYMETNTVEGCIGPSNPAGGGGGWYKSSDGLTYTSAITGQLGGSLNTFCPFGADGYPSIDQTTGKVFQAEFGSVSGADAIQLNIGTPLPDGNLCFLDDNSATCEGKPKGIITIALNNPTLSDVIHDSTEAANFTVSSMDSGRNLWVVWVNHATDPNLHQAWVSVASSDSGWKTWSTPVKVSSAPSKVAIFPWIQAGDSGRADVVWYGDSTLAPPNSTSVKHVWDVYMSQVVFDTIAPKAVAGVRDARLSVNTGIKPQVTQVKVTPHPMDLSDVCLLGTACITALGNRNLADFFEIRTDNTGAAMIVYDDMSNGLCQATFLCPQAQVIDHAGAGVVTIARQASGPGIFDDPVTGVPMNVSGPSNAPVSGLADATGDALALPLFGGNNVPEMDILDHRLSASGQTLTVTTKIAGDPRDAAGASRGVGCVLPTCQVQYVTRWQMGNTLYYAMFENGGLTGQKYYAGATETIDDCSVSACFPHTLVYPEAPPFGLNGISEQGKIDCPATPSAATPCVITETIPVADVGSPTSSSLLEEVGSYTFTATTVQGLFNQATERLDNGATEIDGICCYNFQGTGIVTPPPIITPDKGRTPLPNTAAVAPWFGILALILVGAPLALDTWIRRRRSQPNS
jgi:hypothetical protein